jgi:hypothetical protein
MANSEALDQTLAALRDLGRIDRVDSALIQALKSMADSLDRDPSNAALWGRYLGALGDLLGADSDADSGFADALAEIRGATEVGDSASP